MARTVIGNIPFATTYYADAERVRKYAHVPAAYLHEHPAPGRVPLTIIPDAGEDYGNGYDEVIVSNYRALVRDFGTYGDDNGGCLVTIGYAMSGGEGLAYIGRDDSSPVGEVARALAHEYPLYDEGHYSSLSWDRQEEYLQNGGVWEFRQDTGEEFENVEDEHILAALQAAVSGHDTLGDWDGSGYCAWEDIVSAAATILRGGA